MSYWCAGRTTCLSFVFLLLLGSIAAQGQEYSYARYDVKEGLAGSVVYHGVEDHDGFLWFATETGVSRFDGTHFRNFSRADGLPDNEIIKLFLDSKGRVWMMPFRNSICYYWKGKIYNQENDPLLKKIRINTQVSAILENKQGDLAIVDHHTIHLISKDQRWYKAIDTIEGHPIITSSAGLTSAGNFTILFHFAGVAGEPMQKMEMTPQGKVVNRKVIPLNFVISSCTYITQRLETYRVEDSIQFITLPQQTRKAIAFPEGYNNLSLIDDTLCVLSSGNGAFYYNFITGKMVRHILRGKNVNSVFHDKEGNSWFLTAGAGIFRIGSYEFSNYTFTENNKDYLGIFSLNKFDNLLFAGSEKSRLFTIDLKSKTVQPHFIPLSRINNRVTAIVPFQGGRIMLGTYEGIVEFRTQGKDRNRGASVKSLHPYGNHLLVSIQSGVLVANENLVYRNLSVGSRSTCSFAQDKLVYNGTLTGVYVIDSTGKSTWLGEREPKLGSRIAAIEGAPDGTLWIATHGDGVIVYKGGKILHNITQKDGLTSDICRNLFIAGKEVWVGTDKGLNRLQWKNGQYHITTFTSGDGLIADMVNAIYVDGSQVYVGTPAGLTTFDAGKIALQSGCKLRITGIHALDQQWPTDTSGFMLPPANHAIRFDFVGISYRSAGDITYQYRLVGLNDNWQTTRETFLNYLSLPSGRYELEIRATNKFGVESNTIRIPFQVEKQLWEKTWFRIGALIIAWGLIWIFVNTRIKRVRRLNDEKLQVNNRMAELEQMALKAQMNPHFIFNSLNSVQQYVIDKDLLGANKFITEFSRLIRLTLDISSKTRISIYEEISYLTTYLELEKTKFEDKFTYSIGVVGALDPSDWFIPPMILQPYVENSIRHGVRYRPDNKGHITISFQLDDKYLICQVEDNGIGRKKAGQYKSEMPIEYQSKGMTLTAKRIAMLNKNNAIPVLITIEDLETNYQATGTRVTLQFPLTDAGRNS